MTIALKDTDTNILERLVRQNKLLADDAWGCHALDCAGVQCGECPFLKDVTRTVGHVRKEFVSRAPFTESHKGGGGLVQSFRPECSAIRINHKDPIDQAIYNPKHYSVLDDIEAITLIARSMSTEQFKGYCLGNIIKYRLRLGSKDAVEQDLKKAQNYKDIFEKHKGLCYDYSK